MGGEDLKDADPMVCEAAPPLATALNILWDEARSREEVVDAWRQAADDMAGCSSGQAWRATRGPVSSAMGHLRDLDISWTAPFTVKMLGQEVSLVATPPKQTRAILREHARIHLDIKLVARIAADDGADVDAVMQMYEHGINWELTRDVLRNKSGLLSQFELRAYELLVTNAFWPGQRRWQAGLLGEGTCRACYRAIANNAHRVHLCDGVLQHLTWERARGRAPREQAEVHTVGYTPLVSCGLAPRLSSWQPVQGRRLQGNLGFDKTGDFFGDGSGVLQDVRDRRAASWSLWHGGHAEDPTDAAPSYLRGAVIGWFPTVARGEIEAALNFVERAKSGATYVGDCRYVIDVLQQGIPARARSSASVDVD